VRRFVSAAAGSPILTLKLYGLAAQLRSGKLKWKSGEEGIEEGQRVVCFHPPSAINNCCFYKFKQLKVSVEKVLQKYIKK